MTRSRRGLASSFAITLALIWILWGTAAHASAGLSATPSSLNFGSISVNTASPSSAITLINVGHQSVTILQAASTSAQFMVSGPSLPLTLGPGQGTAFQVVFFPTSSGSFMGAINFSLNRTSGGMLSVPVAGTGVGVGSTTATASPTTSLTLSASISSLSFGNILMGSSRSQWITLTNTGNSSVSISQVNVTGSGFTCSGYSLPLNLAAGQSTSMSVTFAPATTGNVSGSVSVVSNATNSPTTITLLGAGIQPQISVIPTSVSFGNVVIGVSNTQTITISNPGSANLTLTQASVSGSGFGLSGLTLPLTIVPGSSSTFTASFAPATASSISGSISLASNAPTSPTTIAISGTGVAQTLQLSVSPTSLSFGSVTIGGSSTQSLTLTNTGNSSVSVSQLNLTGAGFSVTGQTLPISLSAGQTSNLSVIFAPLTAGSLVGTISIVSNATNSPATVSLSGSGVQTITHSVGLKWAESSSGLAGFNVYRSTVSGGSYIKINSGLVSTTAFTDNSVQSGQTYYYVTTAVDSTGAESAYSNETSAAIP